METKNLPDAVDKLKIDLQARVKKFNNETGLDVCGVMIDGIPTENCIDGKYLIKAYHVAVNIEL